MAQKLVDIPGIGQVVLAKRKGARNLRITIRPDGSVRVGMPAWAPYQAGINFAQSRADWIAEHKPRLSRPLLTQGARIGKSYRLEFCSVAGLKAPRARVKDNKIIIYAVSEHDEAAQKAAAKASEKALRKDAQKLLAIRLKELAQASGYEYRSLKVKKLKSRWGSCSSNKEISLNYYLIQLPWRLLDYVILHELVHTRHMNHSRDFWRELSVHVPDTKNRRAEIKDFRPLLNTVI